MKADVDVKLRRLEKVDLDAANAVVETASSVDSTAGPTLSTQDLSQADSSSAPKASINDTPIISDPVATLPSPFRWASGMISSLMMSSMAPPAKPRIKIAKAAVLMGCEAIISGISPAIAQTMVELGIDLGTIQTTSTIEAALRDSINRHGA